MFPTFYEISFIYSIFEFSWKISQMNDWPLFTIEACHKQQHTQQVRVCLDFMHWKYFQDFRDYFLCL